MKWPGNGRWGSSVSSPGATWVGLDDVGAGWPRTCYFTSQRPGVLICKTGIWTFIKPISIECLLCATPVLGSGDTQWTTQKNNPCPHKHTFQWDDNSHIYLLVVTVRIKWDNSNNTEHLCHGYYVQNDCKYLACLLIQGDFTFSWPSSGAYQGWDTRETKRTEMVAQTMKSYMIIKVLLFS